MKKQTLAMLLGATLICGLVVCAVAFKQNKRAAAREMGLECLATGDNLLGLANLIQYGEKQDIPQIIPLLDDKDPHVRIYATNTLAKISGHSIPYPGSMNATNLADEALLNKYISAWKKWAETSQPVN